jgi:hypothetical protein
MLAHRRSRRDRAGRAGDRELDRNLGARRSAVRDPAGLDGGLERDDDRLGEAAQVQDEREAIAHLVGLEKLFRNKKWFDVATAEQQIASLHPGSGCDLPDGVGRSAKGSGPTDTGCERA